MYAKYYTGPILAALALVIGLANAATIERRAPAQVFTRCSVPNTVALTFDDGPYIYMRDAVNILDAAGIKGSFFLNGNNWACIYNSELASAVKYAFDRGHQIGSHTWSHPHMSTLGWDALHSEMFRIEQAIERITGAVPAFMRPPYGEYNDLVREAAGSRGLSIVNWDFDSEDGRSASPARQMQLYDEVAARHPTSILSLQHEVHQTSISQTLPYAIEKLKASGYRFVTVAECLGLPAYTRTGSPQPRDGNWHC